MPAKLECLFVILLAAALVACASPEATRTRGGGPGADVGNRTQIVQMHEGSHPYWETPRIITVEHPPLKPARQTAGTSRE